ncbi:hypothetical protein GLA29479_4774 [Lysobacter antibioticus]|uniref:hypothetical protein n=1 Tax=Lysobacter antibioticus TaxID=84531 RepID=UPI00071F85EB|nr:hypothetical protein [Lysobacter antibioticus]ALN65603.1 hypothetical protein GLA29479_4774 [Lysobacter antibioticus]
MSKQEAKPKQKPKQEAAAGTKDPVSEDFPVTMAEWKVMTVIAIGVAITVALIMTMVSLVDGSGPVAVEPSGLWRAWNLLLIAGLIYGAYRLGRWPSLRPWRVLAAGPLLMVLVAMWMALGWSVDRYNARWGREEWVVGKTANLHWQQHWSKNGGPSVTVSFRFEPEGAAADGVDRSRYIETSQPLYESLRQKPRLGMRLRRSWAGLSYRALVLCEQPSGACTGTVVPEPKTPGMTP